MATSLSNLRFRASKALVIVAMVFAPAISGCASTKMANLRSVPHSPLVERLQLTARGGPKPSERTVQFLRVYDLPSSLDGDSRPLLEKIQKIIDRDPSADKIYAAAELSYLAAKKVEEHDKRLALDFYGASVLHAYQYLFDPRFARIRNPYDPQFRGACDLYNGALEEGLRIVIKQDGLVPGQTHKIETAGGRWDITCVRRGGQWQNEDFGRFEFVSDYEISGLKNHYQAYGLGVPLIAVRKKEGYEGAPAAARFYPTGLSFPVTAFLRPIPEQLPTATDSQVRRHGLIELYDPTSVEDVAVGDLHVPLESDLTTPLAYFLSDPSFDSLATDGLLHPERLLAGVADQRAPVGLYMIQPYEPGKIPVLLVHGLWSSPMTWMQMFNDLRASSQIRDHYQFWFYLYATAQPFWITAAEMRRDLNETRQILDPDRQEAALDQMVLVGHSMGGLVSRLQTIDSRDDFWKIVSDQPFENVKADLEVKNRLAKCFFFQPNPSIRRVVTIGTPHRGSKFANQTTQWLAGQLINLPAKLVQGREQVVRDNPEVFRDSTMLEINTSIDSLSPQSPVFPVMLAAYRAPWVKYHNIIGLVPEKGLTGWLAAGTDGVVSQASAHMDDVVSEIMVPADHTTVHAHPLAVLEVKRILLEHLAELRGEIGDPQVRMAGGGAAGSADASAGPAPQPPTVVLPVR
ncbi:MAG: alpha/beta fold hydrolase [Pirellulales bacterium]|nr:alpha/beta fold hydrolase [Pirellulales bacterium]